MAAAIRSRKQSTKDERKPNVQPNHLPGTIRLVVKLAGTAMFAITLKQRDKLSAGGNVTFHAGIKDGWQLPGSWMDTLPALSFEVNGTALKIAGTGVHQSEKGNPTVCHSALIDLPGEGDTTLPYMVQVYPTFLVAKGSYNLSANANPFALPRNGGGPQVEGDIEVLAEAGFNLVERAAV